MAGRRVLACETPGFSLPVANAMVGGPSLRDKGLACRRALSVRSRMSEFPLKAGDFPVDVRRTDMPFTVG